MLAGFVESPVFADAQGGVLRPLRVHVSLPGAGGSYLQHEVRRLALLGDDVAIVSLVLLGVHVESNEQVRYQPTGHWRVRCRPQAPFRFYYGGLPVAEVLQKVVRIAGLEQVAIATHVLGFPLRRVRERFH